MKRFLSVVMAVVLVLLSCQLLAGCSGTDVKDPDPKDELDPLLQQSLDDVTEGAYRVVVHGAPKTDGFLPSGVLKESDGSSVVVFKMPSDAAAFLQAQKDAGLKAEMDPATPLPAEFGKQLDPGDVR